MFFLTISLLMLTVAFNTMDSISAIILASHITVSPGTLSLRTTSTKPVNPRMVHDYY